MAIDVVRNTDSYVRGWDEGYDAGVVRGEEAAREQLVGRIEKVDALRDQYVNGYPYRVHYNTSGDSRVVDRHGTWVIRCDFESAAQILAEVINAACERDTAADAARNGKRES